jgi:hypothetical protein
MYRGVVTDWGLATVVSEIFWDRALTEMATRPFVRPFQRPEGYRSWARNSTFVSEHHPGCGGWPRRLDRQPPTRIAGRLTGGWIRSRKHQSSGRWGGEAGQDRRWNCSATGGTSSSG